MVLQFLLKREFKKLSSHFGVFLFLTFRDRNKNDGRRFTQRPKGPKAQANGLDDSNGSEDLGDLEEAKESHEGDIARSSRPRAQRRR